MLDALTFLGGIVAFAILTLLVGALVAAIATLVERLVLRCDHGQAPSTASQSHASDDQRATAPSEDQRL